MGITLKKLLARVILVIFGHFTSSDFKVMIYVGTSRLSNIYFGIEDMLDRFGK